MIMVLLVINPEMDKGGPALFQQRASVGLVQGPITLTQHMGTGTTKILLKYVRTTEKVFVVTAFRVEAVLNCTPAPVKNY